MPSAQKSPKKGRGPGRPTTLDPRLRNRELALKCDRLEQQIERTRREIAEEELERCKDQFCEALELIRDAYRRLALDEKTFKVLSLAFDGAMKRIQKIR